MNQDSPTSGGLSGLQKLLIGCSVGCGAVFVVLLLAAGGGAFWAFVPGKQVKTEGIVGEESVAVVRMEDLTADPGAKALITHVMKEIDEINRRNQEQALPENMRWLASLRRQPSARDVQMFIPRDATLTLEPAEDRDDVDFVAALNFRLMVRPIKAAILFASRSEAGGENETYRGYEIAPMDNDSFLTFVGSTLLVSNSRESLERALDRIEDGTAEPANLVSVAPDGTWDATGSLANDDGVVAGLLSKAPPPAGARDEDVRLGFGFDVVSADEIDAKIDLHCSDPERALLWLQSLTNYYEEIRADAAEEGFELDYEAEAHGEVVETRLRLNGLEGAITEYFARIIDIGPSHG